MVQTTTTIEADLNIIKPPIDQKPRDDASETHRVRIDTLHTTFVTPDVPRGSQPRRSIEIRALVFGG